MASNSRKLWASKIGEIESASKLSSTKKLTKAIVYGEQFYGTVLGIDPSLRGTGLAIIKHEKSKTPTCIAYETIRNAPSVSMPNCLAQIYRQISGLLAKHKVDCVAIESSIYVQNTKTAVILGSARGAAIAAVACAGLELYEYAPLRIKQAVVGFGRASKVQVIGVVAGILKTNIQMNSDESDAAAVALTHIYTNKK
ncbi:MAG: crossover junction endodeoxyribonuclease RuvC [Opitutales bacterium]